LRLVGTDISYNKRSYDTTRRNRGYWQLDLRRRIRMNPVVGLDVSKGESEVQTFLDKGKPYGKSFSI
jgi:hypothetical protein